MADSYRKCFPAISSCPTTSNETATFGENVMNCENGGNRYLYTSNAIYKNPACYECNKGNDTEQVSCNYGVYAKKQLWDGLYHGRYSVNIIFDLPAQQSNVTRYMYNISTTVEQLSFVGRCGPSEAYDPFNGVCMKVCSTNDKNCTSSLIQSRTDLPEYESDGYQMDVQYNAEYWSDHAEAYFVPNDEYYDAVDYRDFDGPACQKYWTCESTQPVSYRTKQTCTCDSLCRVYKDCCHNLDIRSEEVGVSLGCSYIPRVYDRWFIYVVNSCPKGTEYELQRLCSNPDERNIYSSTPVSSLSTTILFRNMHCAMCNGIKDFVFWKSQLRCNWLNENSKLRDLGISELFLRDECSFFYTSPQANITYRECYPKVSSCSEKLNDNAFECKYGENKYVTTSDTIYRNPACYECNNGPNTLETNLTCKLGEFENKLNLTIIDRYKGSYTLNMLFDLSTQQSLITRDKNDDSVEIASFAGRCRRGEAYDPFNGDCKSYCDVHLDNCTGSFGQVQDDSSFTQMCSYVKLNISDFMLMNNSVLKHLASGTLYRQFERLDDSIIICVEKDSHADRSKTLIQVDNIFHMSTNGISMLSLLGTILIYVKTSLHKLPGKCMLCLSLSLLVAQSMLLVAPVAEDNVVWCKVASFVMHYSFLMSFLYGNIAQYTPIRSVG